MLIRRRLLWRLEHDDVVAFCDGNNWRRSQLDGWLITNGLPPGALLAGGSIGCTRDWRGREWLWARTLAGQVLRVRLRLDPPDRLARTWAPEVRRAATGGTARRAAQGTRA